MLLMAGSANRPLAEEIAAQLGTQLCKVTSKRFADGELFVRRGSHHFRNSPARGLELRQLGARISMAHVTFDDHPFGLRMAGRIRTVTADGVMRCGARNTLNSRERSRLLLRPTVPQQYTAPSRIRAQLPS